MSPVMTKKTEAEKWPLLGIEIQFYVSLPGIWPGSDSDDQIAGARSLWLPAHLHADLVGVLVAFAMVAVVAGAGGICPGIFSPARLGQNMIYREVTPRNHLAFHHAPRLHTAVDTGVIVAYQHAFAAPVGLSAWDIDIGTQGDDRRDGELVADRFQKMTGLLDDDCLTRQDQIDRARDGNDCQGFPATSIEQQDTSP